jgi:hypothetical protein
MLAGVLAVELFQLLGLSYQLSSTVFNPNPDLDLINTN